MKLKLSQKEAECELLKTEFKNKTARIKQESNCQTDVSSEISIKKSSTSSSSLNTAPPAPPLPPLFTSFGSPPPPPLPFNGFNAVFQRDKKVPISKVPMKFFNWTKIPCNSYDDTLWVNSDENSVYKQLDLEEFENTFSAYQNFVTNGQETESLFSLELLGSRRSSLDGTDMGLEHSSKSKIKKVKSFI